MVPQQPADRILTEISFLMADLPTSTALYPEYRTAQAEAVPYRWREGIFFFFAQLGSYQGEQSRGQICQQGRLGSKNKQNCDWGLAAQPISHKHTSCSPDSDEWFDIFDALQLESLLSCY